MRLITKEIDLILIRYNKKRSEKSSISKMFISSHSYFVFLLYYMYVWIYLSYCLGAIKKLYLL